MKPKSKLTPYQRITAKQKVNRLKNINQYYKDNPGCTINQAVTFIPPQGESAAMVTQFSKLRTKLIIEGDQDEIKDADIYKYVYGDELK